jgi:hypothetical protein
MEELRSRILRLGQEKFGWSEEMVIKMVSRRAGRDFESLDTNQLADTIVAMEEAEAPSKVA